MLRLSMLMLVVLQCAGVAGQAYPTKPIRVIIPESPGDSCDVLSRSPEIFTATMRKDFERWGELARDIGFKPR